MEDDEWLGVKKNLSALARHAYLNKLVFRCWAEALTLPRGVMVTQEILILSFKVRVLAR